MGGELKHLVLVKFKEDAAVQELMEGMGKLVADMDTVKAFEWGEDNVSEEMLRQGFTHVFMLTFNSAEDFEAYSSHPKHLEFAAKFTAAIDKILLFHFPGLVIKNSAAVN